MVCVCDYIDYPVADILMRCFDHCRCRSFKAIRYYVELSCHRLQTLGDMTATPPLRILLLNGHVADLISPHLRWREVILNPLLERIALPSIKS